MSGRRGFTLIELLVIVAIIAVIIALAIPSLLRSRITANEASAISTLRTINSAEVQFKANNGTYARVADLVDQGFVPLNRQPYLETPVPPPLPGPTGDPWAGAEPAKSGYYFRSGPYPFPGDGASPLEMEQAWVEGYFVFALPLVEEGEGESTGDRIFYTDTGAVIRQSPPDLDGEPASVAEAVQWAQAWPPID